MALKLNAKAIIMSHNHPSGNENPSVADVNITKRIMEACKLFEITVNDHIIVTNSLAYSMKENNFMD